MPKLSKVLKKIRYKSVHDDDDEKALIIRNTAKKICYISITMKLLCSYLRWYI